MTIKVAINGYGRIGRNILRAWVERKDPSIKIVAINDLGDIKTNAHLTRYDSTHGRFPGTVEVKNSELVINGETIHTFSERDPSQLPWGELDIDVVFECTGHFASREKASAHLKAGAKKIIISAPGGVDVDATIVYGVNHHILKKEHSIISNASCTTNCLAPLAKVLHENLGIVSGLMTTIHSYTNDQSLLDAHHSDLRRARSAAVSMIPTKTGAASALGLVIPELEGKLDGYAMRVPTANVSVVDLTFETQKKMPVTAINECLKKASDSDYKGVIAYSDEPLVSVDFNHHPASAIIDSTETKCLGNLVKVLAWYDNEWGFSNRMLDVSQYWLSK